MFLLVLLLVRLLLLPFFICSKMDEEQLRLFQALGQLVTDMAAHAEPTTRSFNGLRGIMCFQALLHQSPMVELIVVHVRREKTRISVQLTQILMPEGTQQLAHGHSGAPRAAVRGSAAVSAHAGGQHSLHGPASSDLAAARPLSSARGP